MQSDLNKTLEYTIDWLDAWDIFVPSEIINKAIALGVKSYDYYLQTMKRLVRNQYAGLIDQLQFVQIMNNLITGQLNLAWLEGMYQNGLSEDDMIDEWREKIADLIANEKDYVLGLSDAIVAARVNQSGLDSLYSRVNIWANRYNEVVSRAAVITADAKTRKMWVLGATEEHCPFCSALNGIVAFASEWETLNVYPQNPPNPVLTGEKDGAKGCEGWHCDCALKDTDKRRSPRAFETIMGIVSR